MVAIVEGVSWTLRSMRLDHQAVLRVRRFVDERDQVVSNLQPTSWEPVGVALQLALEIELQ